jgi:hypothetical protein
MQNFSYLPGVNFIRADRNSLLDLSDGRQIEMDPGFLLQNVANHVFDISAA